MRKIRYSGPRPMISQYGIEFKEGKEDKYVYLTISIQILKAIDYNTPICQDNFLKNFIP